MALPVWQATIVNNAGDVIPSAVVTVLIESTGLPATLFSNRAGTTSLGNSGDFNSGIDGFAQFYAVPGEYRITATDSGSGFSQTWRYVILSGGDSFQQFGLGAYSNDVTSVGTGSFNDIKVTGFYSVGTAVATGPSPGDNIDLIVIGRASTYTKQIAFVATGASNHGKMYIREQFNGIWESNWRRVITDADIQPQVKNGRGNPIALKNTSGGPISAGATDIPGSSLSHIYWDSNGALQSVANSPPGVYDHIGDIGTVSVNLTSVFVRTD